MTLDKTCLCAKILQELKAEVAGVLSKQNFTAEEKLSLVSQALNDAEVKKETGKKRKLQHEEIAMQRPSEGSKRLAESFRSSIKFCTSVDILTTDLSNEDFAKLYDLVKSEPSELLELNIYRFIKKIIDSDDSMKRILYCFDDFSGRLSASMKLSQATEIAREFLKD